jgi:hypothetical protein
MKTAKTTIKIMAIIAAIVVIAIGGYFLKTKGLNFPENGIYTPNNIIEITKDYVIKAGICLALVLIYFAIRYNKLGIVKVVLISLVSILCVQAVTISIIIITRLAINRMFFAILLLVFVLSILVTTAIYEKKLKTL